MADQANQQRMAAHGAVEAPATTSGSMFQGSAPPSPTAVPMPMSRPPANLLPIDILPNEAKSDPDFKEGQGSMYATAQPGLAYKYGVIRNGQRIAPQQLGQPRRGLKQETLQDLETLQRLQGKAPPEAPGAIGRTSEDARIEKEAAAGVAGAAGRFGNTPSDGPQANPHAQQTIQEAVKKLDDFDFNTFREMMMKDIINNEKQRELIESRCKPLDITDLITRSFVTQRVPIIPDKFEPEFQSMTGAEDLAIKRLIMLESKGIEVTERYLLDKFAMMGVTIGVRAINSNPLPDHRDKDGLFDEEAFWKKYSLITKYPFHMIASLGVNYFWFDVRVRKLFVADELGNG
jgi:hypothetical protein